MQIPGSDLTSCKRNNGHFTGHLDNFAGVYAVMNAFFSGRLHSDLIRIELTYGEETDMDGARMVLDSLSDDDTVIVVDVTGTGIGPGYRYREVQIGGDAGVYLQSPRRNVFCHL